MVTLTLKIEGLFIYDHKASLAKKGDHYYHLHFDETERKKVIAHLGHLPEAIEEMDLHFLRLSSVFPAECCMYTACDATIIKKHYWFGVVELIFMTYLHIEHKNDQKHTCRYSFPSVFSFPLHSLWGNIIRHRVKRMKRVWAGVVTGEMQ